MHHHCPLSIYYTCACIAHTAALQATALLSAFIHTPTQYTAHSALRHHTCASTAQSIHSTPALFRASMHAPALFRASMHAPALLRASIIAHGIVRPVVWSCIVAILLVILLFRASMQAPTLFRATIHAPVLLRAAMCQHCPYSITNMHVDGLLHCYDRCHVYTSHVIGLA